ncbi:hypothetical protein ACFSMW_16330 [Virgibacillus halophilus]
MFEENLSVPKLIIGFLNHFFLGILSVSMAALFTRNIVNNTGIGWLGACFALVISIASAGFSNTLPHMLRFIVWILPPIPSLMSLMERNDVPYIASTVGLVYLWIVGYTVVLVLIFFWMQQKGYRDLS